ncbi:hypothetical protein RDWZM_002612 [Blomia tropicalis]|uniref:Uncharacterized protein n=1 Tax=Blomia tropicalis TaxID=40697 RepID=A0A9Q0MGF5_BLOTA|nr:hypothetical protein RDWZM_002612 [Blomia tropicalis]
MHTTKGCKSSESTTFSHIDTQLPSESTPDEFEAILNQLSALGSEIDQELSNSKRPTTNNSEMRLNISNTTQSVVQPVNYYVDRAQQHYSHHYHSQTLGHPTETSELTAHTTLRTDSPDNDSAFSDSISLISTEQSSSSSSSTSSSSSSSTVPVTSANLSFSTSTNSSRDGVDQSRTNPINNQVVNQVCPIAIQSQMESSCLPSPPTSPLSTSASQSDSSSITLGSGSTISIEHQLRQLNKQQELFFEQLGNTAGPLESCNNTSESISSSHSNSKGIDHDKQESSKFIFKQKFGDLCSFNVDGANGINTFNDEAVPEMNSNESIDNNVNLVERNIRLALDKIREANYRKLFIKVFAQDNSAKSLLADERMSIGAICGQLAHKNHISMGTNLCIIEHMPHLYLERFYEDHESLVENVLLWGRDTANKLFFMQRTDKYDLFNHPEKYLITKNLTPTLMDTDETLKYNSIRDGFNSNCTMLRNDLISQFFHNTSDSIVKLPTIEGNLFLRSEGKKVWKKYFFTLRSSGLYYCQKGKPKSTKDLICLTTFEMNCVYYGFGWRKKFKSPTDFGFAIKHPQIQTKSPKHIKYLCCETEDDLRLWVTGIRIVKYGKKLLENYEQFRLISDVPENQTRNEDDHVKSPTKLGTTHSSVVMRANRVNRDESARSSSTSSSSGCMSESGQSSVVSTPSIGSCTSSVSNQNGHNLINSHPHSHQMFSMPMEQQPQQHYHGSPIQFNSNGTSQQLSNGFDADFPSMGTIKRKPMVTMMPKIPLTNTTRNLALQSDDALVEVNENGLSSGQQQLIPSSSDDDFSFYNSNNGEFQRGSFKSGTLRRSTSKSMHPSIGSLSHHHCYIQTTPPPPPPPPPAMIHQTESLTNVRSDSEDELPPPPPPLSVSILKETDSTQSLNNSFPPPPPPEILNPNGMLELSTHVSMTPQPQPKNPLNNSRLTRRSSDLSSNSTLFLNYKNNNNHHHQHNNEPIPVQSIITSPQCRASIAVPSPFIERSHSESLVVHSSTSNLHSSPTGFATMKPYHTRGHSGSSRLHRQLTLDLHSMNKYGTTPRIRNENFIASLATNGTVQYSGANVRNDTNGNINEGTNNNNNNSNNNMMITNGSSPFNQHRQATMSHYSTTMTDHYGNKRLNMIGNTMTNAPSMPPPPPPPSSSIASSSMETHTSAIHTYPSNKENIIYMSISPHLLQKHQQMQQQNNNNTGVSFDVYGSMAIPSPNHHRLNHEPTPETLFLKNMERVMQKKWHVAQMLTQDGYCNSTPGQVLGFRDTGYLPPRDDSSANNTMSHDRTKSVRIVDSPSSVMVGVDQLNSGSMVPQSPTHYPNQAQLIYGSMYSTQHKKIPPPPPRRSEKTHLSNTINCTSSRR